MMRLALSNAASGLLRALLRRASPRSERLLLMDCRSVDWQSLTLEGERHVLSFRLAGPDAENLFAAFSDGLEDAEFTIPGQIVADIAATSGPVASDGSLEMTIEALTIVE